MNFFYRRVWQNARIEQLIQMVNAYIRWNNEKRIRIFFGSISSF